MNWTNTLQYLVLSILIYLIFFLRLDSFWIRPWDESIYAVNTYEMLKKGSFIVPYFEGHPDLLNTKPPLLAWCQMFFIKLIGFNELSIRLPSAICGALTALALFIFIKKHFGTIWAWSSFLVLVTSNGFVSFHGTRTGDMDAMLAFFLLLNNIFLYSFLVGEKENKNISLYLITLLLAFFSKSFAAFFFLPAHLVLLLYFKKIKTLFFSPSFYIGAVLLLTGCIGFILLREHLQPGYINFILKTDIGRYAAVIDLHKQPFDFYFNNFFHKKFSIWIPIFFIGSAFSLLFEADKKIRIICISSICSAALYLFFISMATTKVGWYDMPIYPLLAIPTGYAFHKILLSNGLNAFVPLKQILIMFVLFSVPAYYAIKNSHDQEIPPSERKQERLTEYFYKKSNAQFNFDGWKIIDKWFTGPLLFYKYKLADKGQYVEFINENDLVPGDKVFLIDDEAKKMIELKYKVEVIDTYREVTAYKIIP